jgi:hypothetical protein
MQKPPRSYNICQSIKINAKYETLQIWGALIKAI